MRAAFIRRVITASIVLLVLSAPFAVTSAHAGQYKKIVAVSRFENKSNWSGKANLDDGMADQLTDSLMKSGQFMVLERQTLGDVMSEQDLAASGRAAKSKSAETGKLTSAQVLVKGTITEFEMNASGSGGGIGLFGVHLGGKKSNAHVGLIIRLINTTTGQVLVSQRVEGSAESSGSSAGINLGFVSLGGEEFNNTPLGKATQDAIDKCVELITVKMKDVPFQARVIKATGSDVIIGAGQNAGVNAGDTFTAYRLGEELTDPDTGEQLGSEETKVGTIKVTEVKEKFSKAKAQSGKSYEKGMIVRAAE